MREVNSPLVFLIMTFLLLLGSGASPSESIDMQPGKEAGKSGITKRGDVAMNEPQRLSEDEGRYLLWVARKTIENRLANREDPPVKWKEVPDKFKEKTGTFVTLTIDRTLRGCIGHIIPRETLIEGIVENAVNAAFRDPRFPPLTRKELDKIEIEVSILTPPKRLSYEGVEDLLKRLRPGVDGVILKKGYYEATFLPQVWQQLPDKEEFLSHLCVKAGLSPSSWKTENLEISTYQVQAFEEEQPE
jgi:AmmeMemoRadiSam system protein A